MTSIANMKLIVKVSILEKVEVTIAHCLEDHKLMWSTSMPSVVSNHSDSVISLSITLCIV